MKSYSEKRELSLTWWRNSLTKESQVNLINKHLPKRNNIIGLTRVNLTGFEIQNIYEKEIGF
jgi:hypothetical protein